MNKNDYTIRLEEKNDYRAVENLVRESFWNVYKPGCSEHYVMHVLRDDPAFIQELDFVMEQDGSLIGQNMFMRTIIEADDGRVIDVLTMGPIGITPELKRQGYGRGNMGLKLGRPTTSRIRIRTGYRHARKKRNWQSWMLLKLSGCCQKIQNIWRQRYEEEKVKVLHLHPRFNVDAGGRIQFGGSEGTA